MENLTTTIYEQGNVLHRLDSLLTLREYFEQSLEFRPGMCFELVDENGVPYETFYVGDCTPYHCPTTLDGGVGWDWDEKRFRMFVLAVHMPQFVTRPIMRREV